ncbi:MAG TPA: DUF488 family protein [Candidatus Nesterenkonia stercoripullorum]|uniref:DUF488 family protein n=1 Tax=Candidatus Nesterenkonia stercoripullorum TaxID=2838701 RepID=A0A9D1URR6_9MICC|nr:DUF488 family protein [Candidatus Nesterenkonia stercoripullorum]
MGTPKIVVKRIYEAPDPADGVRVLVDRLWPRGVSKARAQLDEWFKDLAPSPELRSWWDHDASSMDEFSDRYEQELGDPDHAQALKQLIDVVHGSQRVTLLYGAKDPAVNHAVVLQDYLRRHS